MYIAHNALRNKTKAGHAQLSNPEMQQRIAAYQAACTKYKQEIAAIQRYLPHWMPAFDAQSQQVKVNDNSTNELMNH